MTYKKNLKKIKEGVAGVAEEATHTLRKKLVGAAGKVEEDIAERKGIIGGIAEVVDSTVKAGRRTHEKIQEEGGYLKKGIDIVDETESALERTADKFTDAIKGTRDTINNRFYTDGKFDPDRVRAYLSEQADALQHQGERALHATGGLISRLGAAYRSEMPSPAEKKEAYGHIGVKVKHRGALSRKDYEACEAFYSHARTKLPGGLSLRRDILTDILDSASGSLAQLVQHYSRQTDKQGILTEDAKARLEVVGRKNYKL
ncbi:MAG: hypothetical protein ABIJ21_08055 [Nanoarchaeota archaeon]